MSDDFIWFVAYSCALFIAAYSVGWWTGARSLRHRFKMLKQAIENSNKIYKDWEDSTAGSSYMQGYKSGVGATLNTLQAFIEKAMPNDDTP